MKNGLLVLNVILLLLVGVLFYLHFSGKKAAVQPASQKATVASTSANEQFRIAYFELDTIANSFAMVKDVKSELSREEDNINNELNRLQKMYNDRVAKYQSQAQQMSQVQSEQANMDILQLQETIRNKKQQLEQKYQNMHMQKMQDVKLKIENFLKDYNKSKGYSYIFAYEPGFIYYRDTIYNITEDLIKGLNSQYTKKK